MNDCPNCEYHRQRAARWRAEAYKLGGYDGLELPWVSLTDAEIEEFDYYARDLVMDIEAKLKEKNT